MSLVTVKDKFQVTIPAKLREELGLEVGDMLEATIEGDRIVLRPKAVVDRATIAERLSRVLAQVAEPRDEAEEARIMDEVIAEIDRVRAERRRTRR